jgi:hypothetical protein
MEGDDKAVQKGERVRIFKITSPMLVALFARDKIGSDYLLSGRMPRDISIKKAEYVETTVATDESTRDNGHVELWIESNEFEPVVPRNTDDYPDHAIIVTSKKEDALKKLLHDRRRKFGWREKVVQFIAKQIGAMPY